ncbi:uncharacterized protein TNCV_561961 [Trichonephila clavipes]|uniref:Uncharacterized protein n=1 Tax=Trichonephila clavipes TaxID=2585209 RepID=A0A8X6VF28_TRICX|nr:uncharacterized protein TNCV_561961 [Trichonephila clavipes]
MAGKLEKEGFNLPISSSSALIYLELYSLKKSQNLVIWKVPSTHHWYAGNRRILILVLKRDRCSQTTLDRLASGDIKCLSFSGNKMFFSIFAVCHHQDSPEHIMRCLELKCKDIYTDDIRVLDFLKVKDLIDLV